MGLNGNGFTPNQLANAGIWPNRHTVMTFIPKHCHTPTIYFRRMKRGKGHVYFIRDRWIERV